MKSAHIVNLINLNQKVKQSVIKGFNVLKGVDNQRFNNIFFDFDPMFSHMVENDNYFDTEIEVAHVENYTPNSL
jgi:hypothetical protein